MKYLKKIQSLVKKPQKNVQTCRIKPTILITGPDNGGLAAKLASQLQVWLAGGKSVYVTPCSFRSSLNFDGLILSGGGDIGDELAKTTGEPMPTRSLTERFRDFFAFPISIFFLSGNEKKGIDHERNHMESRLVDLALKETRPIFAICRGAQLINCRLGGSLKKSIFPEYRNKALPISLFPCKDVTIFDDSLLAELVGKPKIKVNALHHQVIELTASPLRPVAFEKTGLIQACEAPQLGILAVQWHPEYLVYQKRQRNLFRWLVERSKKANIRRVA